MPEQRENAFDEFMSLRGEYDQYSAISAQSANGDARARMNGLNGMRAKLSEAFGEEELGNRLQAGESADSMFAGLLNISQNNVTSQFTSKLEDIVRGAPENALGETARIVMYEPASGEAYQESSAAHAKIKDLQTKLKEDPQKLVQDGMRELVEEKKNEAVGKLKAKFKYASDEDVTAFATLGAMAHIRSVDPKQYVQELLAKRVDEFKKSFKSDSDRVGYGRAALLQTAKKYIGEEKTEDAQKIVQSVTYPLQRGQEGEE